MIYGVLDAIETHHNRKHDRRRGIAVDRANTVMLDQLSEDSSEDHFLAPVIALSVVTTLFGLVCTKQICKKTDEDFQRV